MAETVINITKMAQALQTTEHEVLRQLGADLCYTAQDKRIEICREHIEEQDDITQDTMTNFWDLSCFYVEHQ